MVGSLLGYFFYVVTAFTAIMALLIGSFDDSTLQSVRHYRRPIIVRAVTATNNTSRHSLIASGAKGPPEKHIETARIVSTAKPDARKRERLSHLYKLKLLARQRENYEARGYVTALGYAEESGYRPGIDTVH